MRRGRPRGRLRPGGGDVPGADFGPAAGTSWGPTSALRRGGIGTKAKWIRYIYVADPFWKRAVSRMCPSTVAIRPSTVAIRPPPSPFAPFAVCAAHMPPGRADRAHRAHCAHIAHFARTSRTHRAHIAHGCIRARCARDVRAKCAMCAQGARPRATRSKCAASVHGDGGTQRGGGTKRVCVSMCVCVPEWV